MSRIGRKPIELPKGVSIQVKGRIITVEGRLGRIEGVLPEGVGVRTEGSTVHVTPPTLTRSNRGYQGLVRALLANMVHGVNTGYERKLEITGVGYKAELSGRKLTLILGYTHPVVIQLPNGVDAVIDKQQTSVLIKGADKQKVGQIAAMVRAAKKPEPYKGKGVRYSDETIKRKVGKSGAR